ncbi:alpha/beta fold hydrolase [Desertibaculum subflavum]|uniref:alpha/beta fold hydrolase n=1 Tax=Desertibaculum subflavum TaxID=2268458 RepID=UPI0013C4EAFC
MLPHFEVHGRGRGPFLLLVHGFLSSRAQWRLNLDALAEVCRPVVVELFGHGRSPAPADPDAYTVAAYLAAFEAIRAQLDAECWFACGQSFGGGLAIRYALAHPERLRGLIFTNSVSALSRLDPAEMERRATLIEQGGRAGLESMRIHPRHARRLPAEVKAELVADAALIAPEAIARSIRVTRTDLYAGDDLHRLAMPVLLVNGRNEAAFQPLRDRAAAAIPGAKVADLEGGHSVNIDAAEGFNRAVIGFLGEVGA